MTNLWLGISVESLCDQHLLGLHKEIHQEAGTIENHPYGDSIVRGHFRLGQVDTTKLRERHEEVVEELEARGFNHDSPLEYRDTQGLTFSAFPIETFNKIVLASRCKG